MNKFLLTFIKVLLSILVVIYLAFLIVPVGINAFVDFDKYKKDIQQIVKKEAKLKLDYSKIKVYTTPLLSAGVVLEDVNINLLDNSNLFKSKKIKGGIALPSLLTLTIKTANCEIINPNINLEIVDDKEYKIFKLIENILKENLSKPQMEKKEPSAFVNYLTKHIKIKVPKIKIQNYEVNVKDLKTKHYLSLQGKELILGYNSAQNKAKVKTNCILFSDKNKNITLNSDIKIKLPKISTVKKEKNKKPQEEFEIPFVNIVKMYQTYDLRSNIDTKLNIKLSKKGAKIFGNLNIDNISLKLAGSHLPDSYLHAIFNGKNIDYDSNLFFQNNEKIKLSGKINHSKHAKIKTDILTDKLHFKNLISLLEGLLDSVNIKNDLANLSSSGYIVADASIETDFKKIISNGSIIIREGAFYHPILHLGIKDFILNLIFDDNSLNIKDTSLTINNSKLNIKGKVDNNSNVDINLHMDELSLPELYNIFTPKEIKKLYKLNSAKLTINTDINGKLGKLNAKINTKLNNLNLSDSKKTMIITNNNFDFLINADSKEIKGTVNNTGFKFNMPQMKTVFTVDKANIDVDDKNIILNPFDLIYNNQSKINVKGKISNYLENPILDIFVNSSIRTANVMQTLGKDFGMYFSSKGVVPFKASITGDLKKQKVILQGYSDDNNYITPINFDILKNKKTLLQIITEINGNKIKISDSGLFITNNNFTDNLQANNQKSEKIADVMANISNNHITFKLDVPKELKGNIAVFKNSSFKTKGKIGLSGKFDNLHYNGDLKINNLNIPELLVKIANIDLNFIQDGLDVKANQVDINGSTLNAGLRANLKSTEIFKINDIYINSEYLNVDKMLKTTELLMKYIPTQVPQPKNNNKSADIKVLANGKFNIKKLTTGNIVLNNTKGDLEVKNNNLIIKNLHTEAFKGNVAGNITINLINQLITIKLNGKNIDSEEALLKAANMKGMISGPLNFKTDISLKGTTYQEQMKSLKGNVDFDIAKGQYGPFAKLENFLLAENIKNNVVFKNTLGTVLTPLARIDTTHFDKLKGHLTFNNGTVKLSPITSQGNVLCLLINGNFNLLNNHIDAYVRARLASAVSNMLGPLAVANPINVVKSTPGLNTASVKLFSSLSQVVSKKELNQIPDFGKNDTDKYATKFQIILKGDTMKPYTIVKSFKWIVLQEDMNKANEFSKKFILEQEQKLKQHVTDAVKAGYNQSTALKSGVEKAIKTNGAIQNTKQQFTKENIQKRNEAVKQKVMQNTKDALRLKMQEKLKARQGA